MLGREGQGGPGGPATPGERQLPGKRRLPGNRTCREMADFKERRLGAEEPGKHGGSAGDRLRPDGQGVAGGRHGDGAGALVPG